MSYPGNELRVRRLKAGLSQKDVYRKLRVPADFVEAIELGTWELLPSPVYTVGFTKTYCNFLGLDPEPYVGAVLAGKRTHWKHLGFGATKDPAERPAWLRDMILWATIIVIGLLGWATYTAVVGPDMGQSPIRVQAESLDLREPPTTERQL